MMKDEITLLKRETKETEDIILLFLSRAEGQFYAK